MPPDGAYLSSGDDGGRGPHDLEKISEIARRVAEKIDFEKKFLAPPGGQSGSASGHVTISAERCRGVLYCVEI